MLTLKSKEIDRCAVEGNLFELCGELKHKTLSGEEGNLQELSNRENLK